MIDINKCFIFLLIVFLSAYCFATKQYSWGNFNYASEFYKTDKAVLIADRIVALQRSNGGWGKIIKPDKKMSALDLKSYAVREALLENLYDTPSSTQYSHRSATIDNGATHQHIRYLVNIVSKSKIISRHSRKNYQTSIKRGIEYLLQAQYPSGGWPQNYPNTAGYGGYVTFNDGAMSGVMLALQQVLESKTVLLSRAMKVKVRHAYQRGIDYILRSQINVDGELTAWGQQHHPETYKPLAARVHELPAIASYESVRIVRFLMSIENPSNRIKRAIQAAVKWFEASKISHVYIKKVPLAKKKEQYHITIKTHHHEEKYKRIRFKHPGYDKRIEPKKIGAIKDASPIWARFYDIDTKRPFFVSWHGKKVDNFSDLDYEIRVSYQWYGAWGRNLLVKDYPEWLKKIN